MRGISVPGGKQDETPGTLSRWFRARWEADETPGTLSQEYRGRWEAGKDTWNAFAGKPWQVDDREETPDMLSQENRGRWTVGKATWNAFAGIPCQVGGGKGYLERFRGNSVPGGRRERLPGTLSREFRARWEAEKDTWNTFAGIPCQVGGRERHLEHFRGKTVAGGRRERTPGTLSQENRGRWGHIGTCRQGHTVALRRSFPQCGPLPFSGADAGFGHSMSLSFRILLALMF